MKFNKKYLSILLVVSLSVFIMVGCGGSSDDNDIASTYELETEVDGSGSIELDPDRSSYEEGDEVAIEAIAADDNWEFDRWGGALSEDAANPYENFVVEEDSTILAVFESALGDLAIETVGEGDVIIEPDKDQYEVGDEVTLTAEADEDWKFSEWYVEIDGEGGFLGSSDELTRTIEKDMIIKALFVNYYEPTLFKNDATEYMSFKIPSKWAENDDNIDIEIKGNYFFYETNFFVRIENRSFSNHFDLEENMTDEEAYEFRREQFEFIDRFSNLSEEKIKEEMNREEKEELVLEAIDAFNVEDFDVEDMSEEELDDFLMEGVKGFEDIIDISIQELEIDNQMAIKVVTTREGDEGEILKDKQTVVPYDQFELIIDFYASDEKFDENIEVINDIIDSIEFK